MVASHFTLSDGRKVPSIGLGTWQSKKGEVAKAVECAIKVSLVVVEAAESEASAGCERRLGHDGR